MEGDVLEGKRASEEKDWKITHEQPSAGTTGLRGEHHRRRE